MISSLDDLDFVDEGLLVLLRAKKSESLVDVIKASFGGDRSEAGRYAANIRWQGSRAGRESSKAKDIREELKTYFGTTVEEYLKSEGYFDIREKRIEKESYNTGIGDLKLELIADLQGFSGKPKVVSSEEIARLEKEGWTIAYRGIGDEQTEDSTITGEELAEQFRTGKYFAGLGTSGNGIYFATDEMVAEMYAGNTTTKTLGGIRYSTKSDIIKGAVVKVAIPPNALMSEADFKDALSKQKDSMRNYAYDGEWYGDDDIGRKLAAQGVKGVEVTLNFGAGPARGSKAVIIYDRSMLAVEEKKETR